MSHFHAVEFALQHRANHNFYLSTLSLTKQAVPALRNAAQYCPIFDECLLI
ncbi:hypothetical protein ACLBOM_29860 [Escherichia coli]